MGHSAEGGRAMRGTLGRARSWLRAPGALETIVGHQRYAPTLARSFFGFCVGLAATIGAVLVTPGLGLNGRDRLMSSAILVTLVPVLILVRRGGHRWSESTYLGIVLVYAVFLIAGLGLFGDGHGEAAAALPAAVAACFLFFSRRSALLIGFVTLAGYAVVLSTPGFPGPLSRWVMILGLTISFSGVSVWIGERLRVLADDERAAAAEVQRLKDTLEARVTAQVEEIAGLSRLERFLPRPVAAAVRSAGDEAILEPHRRQIATLFCDLRGFTTFTAGAEPEEVLDALTAYYDAICAVADELGATVGGLQGDGVLAYFNDPFPCEDPPGKALAMARRLREVLDPLVATWAASGFRLGYGIGVAHGHATLGTVGPEHRRDYTALGSVVNLASRLSDAAGPGEILLDTKLAQALAGRAETECIQIELKGFGAALPVHRLADR